MRLQPASCLLVLLSTASATAQEPGGRWETLYRVQGASIDWLGKSVSGLADVNADGVPDLLVGSPHAAPAGIVNAGSALLLSGADGSVLRRFDGAATGDLLGGAVARAGDVDGDGIEDLIAGAMGADPAGRIGAGSAFVFSGATGQLILRLDGTASGDQFGASVAGPGDVDGDGLADLLVGAPQASPGGRTHAGAALLHSGATGALLRRFDGPDAGDTLGAAVAGAGDVDRDGWPDLLLGAPWAGVSKTGRVWVHSGTTGATIWLLDGEFNGDNFGAAVAGVGDLDGDGAAEFLVGAPLADPGGRFAAGSAFLFSGRKGSPKKRFDGELNGDSFGYAVAGVGDLNADGRPDLAIGAILGSQASSWYLGSVTLLCGVRGEPLAQIFGPARGSSFGCSVAAAGDLDGDLLEDVVVGAYQDGGTRPHGSVFTYALEPFLHPSANRVSASNGVPVLLDLDFPDGEAGYPYAVLASGGSGPMTLGQLEIPLSRWNKLTQLMLGGWTPPVLVNGRGVLDSQGDGQATLLSDVRLARHLGSTIWIAAVSYDPVARQGRLSSIARYLTIVP